MAPKMHHYTILLIVEHKCQKIYVAWGLCAGKNKHLED